MVSAFPILVPAIALVLDFTSWIEACHIKALTLRESSDRSWTKPIPLYFKTVGIWPRLTTLSALILLVWVGGRISEPGHSASTIAAFFALAVHVVVAFLTFRKSLQIYYDDGRL